MKCADAGELTPLYLTGELDAKRAAEFQAHLDECGSCARAIEEQRALDEKLRIGALAEQLETTALEQVIQRRVAEDTGAASRRSTVARWLFAAASIGGILLVGDIAYRTGRPAQPAPVCVDAAMDHRREIMSGEPRQWISDPAALASLAEGQGVPASAIAALNQSGYRLERGRLCFLDRRVFLHLVYTKDGRNFSAYLRPRDSDVLSGGGQGTTNGRQLNAAKVGPERVAFFQTDRLTAVFVAEESGEAAMELARVAARVL